MRERRRFFRGNCIHQNGEFFVKSLLGLTRSGNRFDNPRQELLDGGKTRFQIVHDRTLARDGAGVDSMTGAVAAACLGPTSSTGGGGGGTPNPMAWGNIFGFGAAYNAPLTVSGVGAGLTAPLTASLTGAASLSYLKNGVATTYGGTFTVADGDKIAWAVFCNIAASGTVTVTSGGTGIGSFTYIIKNPGGGGYQ